LFGSEFGTHYICSTFKPKETMQKIQIKTAEKMIEDGDFKCLTDLKIGRVQIKKSNGKIGVIEII
jgi:hypothetical protein